MNKKEYCILNKQYTKEEYERLVPKIIEQMQERGEWGQFFPRETSPFGYNESLVNHVFPLSREEALSQGWPWCDYESPAPTAMKTIPAEQLPDSIDDIPDDVLEWAIVCEVTQKPFKIIPQELQFYRQMGLPLPRRHPDQRHLDRFELRNPQKLWQRKCDKCQRTIQTSYPPERPEKVFCEQCYLSEVY